MPLFRLHPCGPNVWHIVAITLRRRVATVSSSAAVLLLGASLVCAQPATAQGTLAADGGLPDDEFGSSVAWTQVTTLLATDRVAGDWFGSVAIDGNTIAVGAPLSRVWPSPEVIGSVGPGAAYLFEAADVIFTIVLHSTAPFRFVVNVRGDPQ